jgi:hypothetical protein
MLEQWRHLLRLAHERVPAARVRPRRPEPAQSGQGAGFVGEVFLGIPIRSETPAVQSMLSRNYVTFPDDISTKMFQNHLYLPRESSDESF